MTYSKRLLCRILVLAAGMCLLAQIGCKKDSTPPATQPASTTQAAPAGQADDPAVIRSRLLSSNHLKGKVTLIQFGLYFYPLTEQGLEGMILHKKLDDIPGLSFLRVEESDNAAGVEAYYKDKKLGFGVQHDPDGSIAKAFKATSDPTFVLVDKFGRVRYRGPEPDEQLGEWVEKLQAQTADAGPDVAMFGKVALDGKKLLAETSLPDLEDNIIKMKDLLGPEGLVVLLVDTTCPFSGEALRDMPTVAPVLAQANVGSVVVNIDGSRERVAEYFGGKDVGTTLIYDPTDTTMKAWNIRSVPTVVYLTPDEKIAYNGVAVWGQVANAIGQARHFPPGTIKFTVQGTEYG